MGLVHDLTDLPEGVIHFWPRARLLTKFQSMVVPVLSQDYLTPGSASKLFCLLNFLDSGLFGKVGRTGFSPLKERIASVGEKGITPQLRTSLELTLEVLKNKTPTGLQSWPLPSK